MSELGVSLTELWRKIDLGIANEQDKIDVACSAGQAGDVVAIPRLMRLLSDDSAQVRYYALQALVLDLQKTDAEIERHCWRMLREDLDADVRGMAAACLGKIHFANSSYSAFQRLVAELKDPAQPPRAKSSIYGALYKVAGRPPSDWPGLQGPRKVFEESDIDWAKLAQFEDEIRAAGR